jgi:hypothetical protein
VAGSSGNKANLAQLGLELGLSLAISPAGAGTWAKLGNTKLVGELYIL